MIKEFYIKNMVCERCIKVLKNEMEAQNLVLKEIELGRIQLEVDDRDILPILKSIVRKNGFELIDSIEDRLTEQIKIQLIKLLERLPLELQENVSTHLVKTMHQEYSKMSKIFSVNEEITIEKYFIKLKIEKVKELIQAQEKNFTEISQLLDYNHINHLSRQFKSETGVSLTEYKKGQKNLRNSLDQIV